MAKETVSASVAVTPMFAFARTLIDELDRQSAAWMEQGQGQLGEWSRVAKTIREQTTGVSKAMLGTVEQLTVSALDTFGKGLS